MKSFEDLGFYCVDNLPPRFALDLVTLCGQAGIERLALALDVRSGGRFGDVLETLAELRRRDIAFELLYLDARDEVLVRRYSETRRRHPFESAGALVDAIARERAELADMRVEATRIWDTSVLTHATLKSHIATVYGAGAIEQLLAVHVIAFGFKFGLPLDADLVFDVRFLPNPNYESELKALTGSDAAVVAYLRDIPATCEFLERLLALLDFLLPRYIDEGKARLTIAIGCTGGRHRSVYIANRIADHVRTDPRTTVSLEYRDLQLA